jgi:heme exporter protein B
MHSVNSILALFYRELKISYRNFSDILSILMFFLLGILIFVFSIGPNTEMFNEISIGVIWTLILLSNNLSLRKFYQNDFNDGSIILLHMSGLSYELIVLIKIMIIWIFLQLPFFIIIPLAAILLNIELPNVNLILISFLIGSPILTSIASISGSMNLLNQRNFAIGSVIIMILSIPIIIFSVGIINASEEIVRAQLQILIGILFFFLAITPWVSAACIKLAIQNK